MKFNFMKKGQGVARPYLLTAIIVIVGIILVLGIVRLIQTGGEESLTSVFKFFKEAK
jgi:hypothetical protein